MKDRIRLVGIVFLVGNVALLGRLFYWQIMKSPSLSEAASLQQTNRQNISSKRGQIFADDGSILAGIAASWKLSLYRPEAETPDEEIIRKVAPLLSEIPNDPLSISSESAKLTSLLASRSQWIPLKPRITREQKSSIEALKIKGLGFEDSSVRSYPEASMSAHVLGFLGKDENADDQGYFGLEGFYDLLLSGKSGVYESRSNALGVPLVSEEDLTLNSFQGADLHTSINKTIQLIAEKNLADGLTKYDSQAGNIIVMDPKTGEILALASFPAYHPAQYMESSDQFFRDPVISDSFEPGSILKPIVMSAALDAGVITTDTICDICNKPYVVGQYVIRTWNNQYNTNATMQDIITHSDNVGMVFIGSKLGTNKLIDYLQKFGFGNYTGVDLQGEYAAPLRNTSEWGEVERDTASFGQGIAVTPIQMLKAISVIANGGSEVTPHVVRSIELGSWKTDKNNQVGKRVISEKVSSQMKNILVNAVDNGEAKWAVPKEYKGHLAGKTGTAQVAIDGVYDDKKTNASFIGFAPAQDPKFAMLITLREPKASPWAAETAAPLWFKVAGQLLHFMGVAPEN